jgi:hypothetical protein
MLCSAWGIAGLESERIDERDKCVPAECEHVQSHFIKIGAVGATGVSMKFAPLLFDSEDPVPCGTPWSHRPAEVIEVDD